MTVKKYLLFGIIAFCTTLFLFFISDVQAQKLNIPKKSEALKNYKSFFKSAVDLIIYNHYTTNYENIFAKENIFDGREETFQAMFLKIKKQFKKYKKQLIVEWNLKGKLLEAAFILNVVNNMYGLGEEGKSASVFANKNNTRGNRNKKTGYLSLQCATAKDYLKSDYGDCNDYAMMMYIFLNLAGIENRQVGTPDHIYNEVKINGKYYIFDALYLFFTQMDNEKFLHQSPGKRVVYHTFYLDGANPLSKHFRTNRGAMRMYYFLSQGRTIHLESKDFSHWNRFDIYIKNNKVCQP